MQFNQEKIGILSHRNLLIKQILLTACVAFAVILYAQTVFASSLGAAGDYSVFVFEDFTASGSEVRGRLAAGGNVTLSGYTVGIDLQDTSTLATLVAGGNLNYNGGTIYGNAAVGGISSLAGVNYNSVLTGSSIDFAEAYSSLTSLSATLALMDANGATMLQWGGLYLTGDNTSSLQIFNVSAADLSAANWISLSGVPTDATVIINVSSGSEIVMNGKDQLQNIAGNVLFNFYQAESLTIYGSLAGTILATKADIAAYNGHIYGSVIAESWTGGTEVGYVPFEGTLPVTSVPEPATLILLFSGLIGLAGLKRRMK